MSRKMNEYELIFNASAGTAPREEVAKWLEQNDDVGHAEPKDATKLAVVATEDVARKVVESFNGTVAKIELRRENAITVPSPYQKKARRPGFSEA